MVNTHNPPTYTELKAAVDELAKAKAQLLFPHDPELHDVFLEQEASAQRILDALITRMPSVRH